MEIEQIIVLIIAAYGAILSTIIYIQKWHENKPHIQIDYCCEDPYDQILYIALIVRNHGKKSITLSYALLEDQSKNYQQESHEFVEPMDRIDGTEITSGKKFKIPFSIYQVPDRWVNNKMQIVGIVVDQLGNKYQSGVIEREPYRI